MANHENSPQVKEPGPHSKPHEVFAEWMALALGAAGIREPTAMVISTLSSANELHSRVVLCKHWSEEGFEFYTNYLSQKGQDVHVHPQAAALFYWDPLFMQVKISGMIEKSSRADSENYWNSRPRESQLSQYVSKQSQPVSSREEMEAARARAEREFAGKDIPCPPHWGGYWLKPKSMEFWIGRPNRFHDRFHFEKHGRDWTFRRLCP